MKDEDHVQSVLREGWNPSPQQSPRQSRRHSRKE
eukprot:CAMPEP_0168365950 /NCGR_PEP_ID=MMETSP0228-20121227/4978_1 /TAXON_ID=133427 /ORGANISM="Protoceratium reticulatum, Strain CCCM 535 (=CCMP 1889)" /LENGTH=33 /DNA_ID= /DNA_START= /DNA_END= /DNA_ORIENTATION=